MTVYEELLESSNYIKCVNNKNLILMQEGAINFTQLHNMITKEEYYKLLKDLDVEQ